MKKIHYRNIGFPKSGTSWLWMHLMKHPEIDGRLSLPFKEYRGKTLSEYKAVYQKYNISVNLDTAIFSNSFDDDYFATPKNIDSHTTHITCSLRNPYDVLNSMYNMGKNNVPNFTGTQDSFTNIESITLHTYTNFEKLFDDWDRCPIKVKYMFYDDLVDDPKKYIIDICEYLGLTPYYNNKYQGTDGWRFSTKKTEPLVFDNAETIEYINTGISVIEKRLNRDLSHWKK
jgi:hypothetical protein